MGKELIFRAVVGIEPAWPLFHHVAIRAGVPDLQYGKFNMDKTDNVSDTYRTHDAPSY